jgi:hypothetical protein
VRLNLLTVLLTLFTLSDDAQCSAKRSIATESKLTASCDEPRWRGRGLKNDMLVASKAPIHDIDALHTLQRQIRIPIDLMPGHFDMQRPTRGTLHQFVSDPERTNPLLSQPHYDGIVLLD